MNLFLGIDGGGSNTRALVCEASGRIVGTGLSGPSNPQSFPVETVVGNLATAVEDALEAAGGGDVAAAFLGIAGVVSPDDRKRAEASARKVGPLRSSDIGIDHDIRIALAGGLAGRPGIALIAGTGSSCYGRDAAGRSVQCGGWGDGVDDVGSGGWLGLRALQCCVRQADGREPETALKAAVIEFLGIADMEEFQGRVHRRGLSRPERARFAPKLVALRAQGDPAAAAIVEEGVAGLVEMVGSAFRRLGRGNAEVVLAGGLANDGEFGSLLSAAIEAGVPGCRVRPPELSPVAGAALLALERGGLEVSQEMVQALAAGRGG